MELRPKIILFGDSITQQSFQDGGWGASLANYFCRTADIVVRGYSGYNTRWALQVMDRVFPPNVSSPLAVTIFFGANDASLPDRSSAFQHVPADEFKKNLNSMVSFIKVQEAKNPFKPPGKHSEPPKTHVQAKRALGPNQSAPAPKATLPPAPRATKPPAPRAIKPPVPRATKPPAFTTTLPPAPAVRSPLTRSKVHLTKPPTQATRSHVQGKRAPNGAGVYTCPNTSNVYYRKRYPTTVVLLITPPPIDEDGRLKNCYQDDSSGLPERTNEAAGAYAKECIAVAGECGVTVVDLWSKMQLFRNWGKTLLSDGLHLTPTGNKIVFEQVLGVLKKEGISVETLPADLPLFQDIDPNDPAKSLGS